MALTHESDVSRRVVKMDGRKVDMCHCNSRLGYNRENRARRAIWVVLSLIVDYYSWRYRRHLRRLWRVGESVSTRLRSGDAKDSVRHFLSSTTTMHCDHSTFSNKHKKSLFYGEVLIKDTSQWNPRDPAHVQK